MSPKKDKADKLAAKKLGKKADKKLAKNAASSDNELTEAEINELQANVQVDDWGEGAPPRKAKAFWPSTIHSSPSRRARVCSDARSDPELGSLKSWHQISPCTMPLTRIRPLPLLRATSFGTAKEVRSTMRVPMSRI